MSELVTLMDGALIMLKWGLSWISQLCGPQNSEVVVNCIKEPHLVSVRGSSRGMAERPPRTWSLVKSRGHDRSMSTRVYSPRTEENGHPWSHWPHVPDLGSSSQEVALVDEGPSMSLRNGSWPIIPRVSSWSSLESSQVPNDRSCRSQQLSEASEESFVGSPWPHWGTWFSSPVAREGTLNCHLEYRFLVKSKYSKVTYFL